ncbi:MAG: hypothetical protein WDM76_13030 [Limisphaerales bacterium]
MTRWWVFDADGKFVRSWGKEYKGGAHGLHLSREGKDDFSICAIRVVTNLPRRPWTAKSFGANGHRNNATATPIQMNLCRQTWPSRRTEISSWADGYGKSFIHEYDRNAKYIRSFGGKGSAPGQTDCRTV